MIYALANHNQEIPCNKEEQEAMQFMKEEEDGFEWHNSELMDLLAVS